MNPQRSPLDVSSADTSNHRSGVGPNEHSTGFNTPINTPVPASLAIAVAFIYTHSADSLSSGTIASVADLSMWESQQQFISHFGVAPMQYIRQLRLEGVRAESARLPRVPASGSLPADGDSPTWAGSPTRTSITSAKTRGHSNRIDDSWGGCADTHHAPSR